MQRYTNEARSIHRLDPPINPSAVVVRFCFRKWMPRRATLFDPRREQSTKLQIPIDVSRQFAPRSRYVRPRCSCSQLGWSTIEIYFCLMVGHVFLWHVARFKRRTRGKIEDKKLIFISRIFISKYERKMLMFFFFLSKSNPLLIHLFLILCVQHESLKRCERCESLDGRRVNYSCANSRSFR